MGFFLALCYNERMRESFYFYDLETSGLNPRGDRIMQFAGMRTDLDFQPIGEPTNILVELPNDTLPSPQAIMVTGITPNSTRLDGITEREFCRFLVEEIATPKTTIVGYNSVRFDDEFVRNALWRNFHDAYEWQWKDGRSRWDLLDVVRMTRALRPEGIIWPVTPEGRPTNRLELITKENGISHEHAHDALSDVEALISVTKLIKEKQPQLFNYLYDMRDKRTVAQLVNLKNPRPFVYSSGRYPSSTLHTTVAYPIAEAPNGNILVFDLRHNLDELLSQEAEAIKKGEVDPNKPFRDKKPWEKGYFPIVKKMQYNRCPAVAPVQVLERDNGWDRIQLSKATVDKNLQSLLKHPEFGKRMSQKAQVAPYPSEDPESALYDGFLNRHDQQLCMVVSRNDAEELADFQPPFNDERLPELFMHYKARNFPEALSGDEMERWEQYRQDRLNRQAPKFLEDLRKIQSILANGKTFGAKTLEEEKYLAEELLLWYQSLQSIE